MAERIVFDCELQALSDYLFPKMAPARSINPYSVLSDLFPRRTAPRKSLYAVRSNRQISDRIFRRSTKFA
jgi:hypothetical protein